MHKGHDHDNNPPKLNGRTRPESDGTRASVRSTTSDFTTPSIGGTNGSSSQPHAERPSGPAVGIWGSYEGRSASYNKPATPVLEDGGFGGTGAGGERPTTRTPGRSFAAPSVSGPEESVVVTLLPEKEGMFMFQHHNYHVTSHRRGSKVVRRYSDFVWLLDCLQKRFPFRQIPLLPPKRVGGMVVVSIT